MRLLISLCCCLCCSSLHAQVDALHKNILTTNDVALGAGLVLNAGVLDFIGVAMAHYGVFGFLASDLTVTNIQLSNLPPGNNDVFTCPAGKRMVFQTIYAGTTNNANAVYTAFKTNGVYYRLIGPTTVNTNNFYANPPNFIILEEGETFVVNATKQGLNVKTCFALFSNTNLLYSPRLLALSGGNDTLYTVPTGRMAVPIIKNSLNSLTIAMVLLNQSGGARTYELHVVPPGGSVDDSNTMYKSLSVADATSSLSGGFIPILVAGDSLVLKSDAATTVQAAWITVAEIPFP